MKEEKEYQLLFKLLDSRLETAEAEAERIFADVIAEPAKAETMFVTRTNRKHGWLQIAAVLVVVLSLAGGAGFFLHTVLTPQGNPNTVTSTAADPTGTDTIAEDPNIYPLVFLKLPDACTVSYVDDSGLLVYTIKTPTCTVRMEQSLDTPERNEEFNRLRQGLVDGLPTVRREQLYESEGYIDLTCDNLCIWWCSGRYLIRFEAEGDIEDAIFIAKWIKEEK